MTTLSALTQCNFAWSALQIKKTRGPSLRLQAIKNRLQVNASGLDRCPRALLSYGGGKNIGELLIYFCTLTFCPISSCIVNILLKFILVKKLNYFVFGGLLVIPSMT